MSETYDGGDIDDDDEELDVDDEAEEGEDILAWRLIEFTLFKELVTLLILGHMTSSKL